MYRRISSDEGADALVQHLAVTPLIKPTAFRMHQHVPRHFARFLGGVLQRTTQPVTIQGARLLGELVSLEDAWPAAGAHPSDLTFFECTMDAAFLDALLYLWLPNATFKKLAFVECRFTGELRPIRNPPGLVTVDTLHVKFSTADFTYYIGVFAKSARIRVLDMAGVNQTFADWLPYIHRESLRSLLLADIIFDDASTSALANVIGRARGLTRVELVIELRPPKDVLPDAVAEAIGAHPREKIWINWGTRISAAGLAKMLSAQTTLVHLSIPFTSESGHSGEMMAAVIRHNPLLEEIGLSVSSIRDYPHDYHAVIRALLQHPRIVQVSSNLMTPELQAHLKNNSWVANLIREISVDTAPLAIVPVLVTGALRDVVHAQLVDSASSVEQQVARAIVRANPGHMELLRSLLAPGRIADLLGDELRAALDAPPTEAEVVAYAASAIPPTGFPGGVHVFAPRAKDRHAFEEMAMTTTSFFEHNVLVSDERHSASMTALHARQRGASYAHPASVRAEVVARHAQVPRASMPLRDQLCLLAVVRAAKHVLSAAEVADLCAEFGAGARLPSNPYTYALPGGHVIARMPAVLDALRDTFARPALLARIVNRAGRVRADWFRDGVLPAAAAVDVFNHVLELDDNLARTLAEEAVRVLTTFDVIFPVRRDRAVFPKFRGVPPIMYRALAFLLGRDTTRVLAQDDAGAITFVVTGEKMVARYADGAIAVAAENPVAPIDVARVSHVLNQVVDL